MTRNAFQKLYQELNTQQKKAVNEIEGAVMVIAGPGTGKTQILTLRIANILLNTQVNPENILALTFTDSGVHAMRKRLVSIIGSPAYRVEIATFHGFCNEVIKRFPENFERLISSVSITELEQIALVEEIITNEPVVDLRPYGDPLFYIKPVLAEISNLKKERITPQFLSEALKKQEEDFWKIDDLYNETGKWKGKQKMKGKYMDILKAIKKNKQLVIVYTAYERLLHERKLYDFNDMLLEVITALETDEQLLLSLQEQYQYILVDEHQDTNDAQNKLIELLCNFYDNPNLFVVGDEKQSIYRFQGASLENFLYFKKLYSKAQLINLEDNYRSCQTILDGAGSLILHNVLASKELPAATRLLARKTYPNEHIKIVGATDYHSELYYIAREIKKRVAEGTAYKEIALLGRNNSDLPPFAQVLEQQEIPYVIESNHNVLADSEIKKMILLFRAIYALGSDEALIKAMHIDCLAINAMDIYKLLIYAHRKKSTIAEELSQEDYTRDLVLKTQAQIQTFYEQLIAWKTVSENDSFDTFFVRVLHDSQLLQSILGKKNSLDVLDKVTSLYEDIKVQMQKNPDFSLKDFIDYLTRLSTYNVTIKKSVKTARKNAVRLMTAHKSKGLEFDYVFVVSVIDGSWGNARKRGTAFKLPWEYLREQLTPLAEEEKNEDERRLFYVALTRARKEVIVSFSTHSLDAREQSPSQFIEEIQESYKRIVAIDTFEEEFLAHKEAILLPQTKATAQTIRQEFFDNREFFAELFKQRGLAATGLNNYLECPWKYFFNTLIRIPETMDINSLFGDVIHKALNTYLSTKDKKGDPLQFLLEAYNNALSDKSLPQKDFNELQQKGKEILEGYYKEAITQWGEGRLSELAIKGISFAEDIMLTGKIDMIEPIDGSSEVIVYDFKTGKPKSRGEIEGTTKNSDGNYKRQLVFYKILLDRFNEGKMNMHTGVIEFVQPTDSNTYQSHRFAITKEEVHALEETIQQVSQEILTLSFWDKTCKKTAEGKECEFCVLRSYIGM